MDRKKRITTFCCVPQCNTYSNSEVHFHYFPKEPNLKKKWETALRMGKPASKFMRVCSKHFTSQDYFPGGLKRHKLFPTTVPSKNIPQRSHEAEETSPKKRQIEARSNRAKVRAEMQREVNVAMNNADDLVLLGVERETTATLEFDKSVRQFSIEATVQVNLSGRTGRSLHSNNEEHSLADILSEGSLDKAVQVNLCVSPNSSSEREREPSTVNNNPSGQDITLPDLLNSDSKLFTFSGILSLELLNGLVFCAEDLAVEASTNKKVLSLKDRIILTMIKIKLNISFSALSVLFGISRQTCSNYFKNTCPILARVLKVMIPWPDQENIRANLPLSFKNFKNTRIILDCAETVIAKCKCLKCRVLTYSQYKKNHTAKFNVGITPSGLITEISCSYEGRASDKLIVNESEVLNKLDYKDGVMVDKGFQIERECVQRHLQLIRPSFLRQKQQMSREDALLTADIARARVHVERVIQRLREFELLRGPLPWPLAPYFDDCLIIAAGLTNLSVPIISIDKFM